MSLKSVDHALPNAYSSNINNILFKIASAVRSIADQISIICLNWLMAITRNCRFGCLVRLRVQRSRSAPCIPSWTKPSGERSGQRRPALAPPPIPDIARRDKNLSSPARRQSRLCPHDDRRREPGAAPADPGGLIDVPRQRPRPTTDYRETARMCAMVEVCRPPRADDASPNHHRGEVYKPQPRRKLNALPSQSKQRLIADCTSGKWCHDYKHVSRRVVLSSHSTSQRYSCQIQPYDILSIMNVFICLSLAIAHKLISFPSARSIKFC